MKRIFTLVTALTFGIQLNAQIFHKKYAYSYEIMDGATSVINNNRIYTTSSSIMLPSAFPIQKTDLAGNLITVSQIVFGTSGPNVNVRKMITSGDKLYIVGTINPGSTSDALLVVLDTNLTTIIYAKTYGTSANGEEFNDILMASNTDLVMVGNTSVPTATASTYRYLPYVVRAAAPTGNSVYQKAYDDGLNKITLSVVENAVNNSLFIAGQMPSNAGSHIFKITDDNLGNVLAAKNMFFSGSNNFQPKNLQVLGSKLFMVGKDFNNSLVTIQTDININTFGLPKNYSNFKYWDMVKVNNTNYIAGLPTTSTSINYLSSISMDSLFNPLSSMTYSLVALPFGSMWYGINVVNKSNTMYWIANEGWTAPTPYTNRYIVASDMVLNAVCNNSLVLTTANLIQTAVATTYTNPLNTYNTNTVPCFPATQTPTVTTLCSPTGIENVNENFEKFVIKNGLDKIIIESPYSNYSISVFDMAGKMISKTNLNSQSEELNISNLPGGIYVIKLDAKGYEQRQKFFKP